MLATVFVTFQSSGQIRLDPRLCSRGFLDFLRCFLPVGGQPVGRSRKRSSIFVAVLLASVGPAFVRCAEIWMLAGRHCHEVHPLMAMLRALPGRLKTAAAGAKIKAILLLELYGDCPQTTECQPTTDEKSSVSSTISLTVRAGWSSRTTSSNEGGNRNIRSLATPKLLACHS